MTRLTNRVAVFTFITAFALAVDASGEFSTSAQVTGQVFAAAAAVPAPANLTAVTLGGSTVVEPAP